MHPPSILVRIHHEDVLSPHLTSLIYLSCKRKLKVLGGFPDLKVGPV
jgi:hypothetical protein